MPPPLPRIVGWGSNGAMRKEQGMPETTIDAAEVEKFGAMAEEWWNPDGKFRPIHKFNPVRLSFIREHAIRHFNKDGGVRRPLVRRVA
jgi:2-polyprenyl-3-methyl-5-hydroxy-6-metoxy-1,4-benzoquinol methylase